MVWGFRVQETPNQNLSSQKVQHPDPEPEPQALEARVLAPCGYRYPSI